MDSLPRELAVRVRSWDDLNREGRRRLGRDLRFYGLSYGEIRELIPVPKGTLSGWCREISLTDQQVEAIRIRTGTAIGLPRDTQRKRRWEVEHLRAEARRRANALASEPFWAAGVALYWAEGAKTARRLQMSNGDPGALRMFMGWTEAYLDAGATYRAAIWLHRDNDEGNALAYWGHQLGLEATDFTKSYIKADGTGHRRNRLEHGVCRVSVRRSADMWVTTMAWCRYLSDSMGVLPSRAGR